MTYENLRTKGTLTDISHPSLLEREVEKALVFPDKLYLTRVTITGEHGSRSTEIFAPLPRSYLGKEVELVQSYLKEGDSRVFMQELYLDGRQVVNQVVVRKE